MGAGSAPPARAIASRWTLGSERPPALASRRQARDCAPHSGWPAPLRQLWLVALELLQAGARGYLLKSRERQVVRLIAEGHSNKDVAPRTVETHRAGIMRKLNIASPAALVRYAVRNKLVEP